MAAVVPFAALTARARRRTQAERRRESEEALVAAAAELIAERGIDGATLAGIGERAGTSRALLTHHFGSKDALVAEVARRAQDRIYRETLAAIEVTDREVVGLPALVVLKATVETYLRYFEDPSPEGRALLVLWGATFPSESTLGGMVHAERRAHDGWVELVERGKADGSIRPSADADACAVVLQGLIRGVAAHLLPGGLAAEAAPIRQMVADWVDAALAPTTPTETSLSDG